MVGASGGGLMTRWGSVDASAGKGSGSPDKGTIVYL